MNYFGFGLLGVAFSLAVYKGYYFGKEKLVEYIMDKMKKELDKNMENEEESFQPFHRDSSARIKISQRGKTHSIYLPYDRKKSSAMLRKKVYLIKGKEKIELNQKPGVPYLVSASDLGGEEIIIENFDGNLVHSYKGKEIPNCF